MNNFKKRSILFIAILLAITCTTSVWAEETSQRTRVEALYDQVNKAVAAKDVDALLALFSDDFKALGTMAGKEHIKGVIENLFQNYEQLKQTLTIDKIRKVDTKLMVFGDVHLQFKKTADSSWNTIIKEGYLDILREENGELKISGSGKINKDRMKLIHDNTFSDPAIGYSFSIPKEWSLIPIDLQNMQNSVAFMTPDGHMTGFFGHVQIPYNVGAKEAIEGDDAVTQKVLKTFKKIQSGPVTIHGIKGYQSTTQFAVKEDGEELTRRRVYLSGGGLLYVFVMNAPTEHWDEIKDKMDPILESFTLSPKAKTGAAALAREKTGSGEIMEGIYTNDELGCQIAAPKGWKIENSPIGSFPLSIIIKPPQGKSIARLLAIDTKGLMKLEDVFDQEMNGIKAITEDFTINRATEDTEVGGLKGRTAVFTFKLEGLGVATRKSIMLLNNNILFMILCDAIQPEKFDDLEPSFDAIIQSFTVN